VYLLHFVRDETCWGLTCEFGLFLAETGVSDLFAAASLISLSASVGGVKGRDSHGRKSHGWGARRILDLSG
jgi:hypothetical protein